MKDAENYFDPFLTRSSGRYPGNTPVGSSFGFTYPDEMFPLEKTLKEEADELFGSALYTSGLSGYGLGQLSKVAPTVTNPQDFFRLVYNALNDIFTEVTFRSDSKMSQWIMEEIYSRELAVEKYGSAYIVFPEWGVYNIVMNTFTSRYPTVYHFATQATRSDRQSLAIQIVSNLQAGLVDASGRTVLDLWVPGYIGVFDLAGQLLNRIEAASYVPADKPATTTYMPQQGTMIAPGGISLPGGLPFNITIPEPTEEEPPASQPPSGGGFHFTGGPSSVGVGVGLPGGGTLPGGEGETPPAGGDTTAPPGTDTGRYDQEPVGPGPEEEVPPGYGLPSASKPVPWNMIALGAVGLLVLSTMFKK